MLERHRTRLSLAAIIVSACLPVVSIANLFALGVSGKLLGWSAITCGVGLLFARFLYNRARGKDAHLFAIFMPGWQDAGTPGDYICLLVLMFLVIGAAVTPYTWQ
jgi:hypothetical protein